MYICRSLNQPWRSKTLENTLKEGRRKKSNRIHCIPIFVLKLGDIRIIDTITHFCIYLHFSLPAHFSLSFLFLAYWFGDFQRLAGLHNQSYRAVGFLWFSSRQQQQKTNKTDINQTVCFPCNFNVRIYFRLFAKCCSAYYATKIVKNAHLRYSTIL